MKNIHILPTDKPNRLYKNLLTDKLFILENSFMDVSECNREYQNIYITSDEGIQENDYIVTKDGRLVQVSYLLSKDLESASKIILTTDQELIKDGVQAINDDFLEWFVKNPSCEEVDIVKDEFYSKNDFINGRDAITYKCKIIIPREEPKQQTAVEFLISKLQWTYGQIDAFSQYVREAKEMEKEQLRECYHFAQIEQQKEFSSIYVGMSFEKWYNEIYKNE